MIDPLPLKGRAAIVTGAGGGIGRAGTDGKTRSGGARTASPG